MTNPTSHIGSAKSEAVPSGAGTQLFWTKPELLMAPVGSHTLMGPSAGLDGAGIQCTLGSGAACVKFP